MKISEKKTEVPKKTKTLGELDRDKLDNKFSKKKSEVLIIADNNYDNKFSIGINYKDKNFFPTIKKYLKNCKFIIDHEGAWQNYNLADKYYLTGASGWL